MKWKNKKFTKAQVKEIISDDKMESLLLSECFIKNKNLWSIVAWFSQDDCIIEMAPADANLEIFTDGKLFYQVKFNTSDFAIKYKSAILECQDWCKELYNLLKAN